MTASVAAAMGLSSLLKVSFNAASTQVITFNAYHNSFNVCTFVFDASTYGDKRLPFRDISTVMYSLPYFESMFFLLLHWHLFRSFLSRFQVLPFLALGLGVDDMFLVARTYVSVCESKDFDESQMVGETLRNCGLSVTLTSFTNACAFIMASFIPVPALQAFSRQVSKDRPVLVN